MKIVFLNRYFFPDHSATSQVLSDVAFHLAAAVIRVRLDLFARQDIGAQCEKGRAE